MKIEVHEYEEVMPVYLRTKRCWRDTKYVERLVVQAYNEGGWSYVALDAEELYNELKRYYDETREGKETSREVER